MRPGTSCRRAEIRKNRLMIAAPAIMVTTELVIERSSAKPPMFTGGRSTTLWTRNWCIGSMAAIGSNVLSILVILRRRRRRRRLPEGFLAHARHGVGGHEDRHACAHRNADGDTPGLGMGEVVE